MAEQKARMRDDSSKMPAWSASLTHFKVPAWVEGEWMELELAQRKAILASQVSRWPKATKQEKSEILDAICQSPAGTETMPAR